MPSVIILSAVMLNVIDAAICHLCRVSQIKAFCRVRYAVCHSSWVSFMLSVIYAECLKQAHYAECCYAKCLCHSVCLIDAAICNLCWMSQVKGFAECWYIRYRYAECHSCWASLWWMSWRPSQVIILSAVMLNVVDAAICHLCRVSQINAFCRVLICCVSLILSVIMLSVIMVNVIAPLPGQGVKWTKM
jgi:hypothetical protein